MNKELLSSICDINPSIDKNIDDNIECSFIPMENIDDISGTIVKTSIRRVGDVKKGYTFFRNGDVIFAKITPCMENGKCAIAKNLTNGIAFGSTEFHVVRAINKIIPEWIYYYLRQEIIRKKATLWFRGTAGQQRVPSTFLEELPIPLPSLDEQIKIVGILIRADYLRKMRRYSRKLGETFLQSVFVEMFGDIILNSKKWEIMKAGNIFEIQLGKMLSAKNYKGTHLKPYLRNLNVQWGYIDFSDINQMDFNEKEFQKYSLRDGDILVCEGGEVGRTAIYHGEIQNCCYQNALHRLRVKKPNINSEYFVEYMKVAANAGLINRSTSQVTIAHFTAEKFKEFDIIIPPLADQDRFSRLARRYDHIRTQQHEAERQAEGLFQALLEKAFGEGI